jgi:hypothetical protein
MTAVLPTTLAPADATATPGTARPSPAAALARRVLARTIGWARARTGTPADPRLGDHAKSDIGLLPEQELDGVFHERDDLLWRL